MPRSARFPSRRKASAPDASALTEALAALNAGGAVEVYEQGKFLPQFTAFHSEVRVQAGRLLLQLWSEEGNIVRQVTGIAEDSGERLALEVLRFGKKEPLRLEFVRKDARRPPERLTREKFRSRFAQFLGEHFPDEDVESLTTAPDLEHSFSGNLTRGVLTRGGEQWAVLGAGPGEQPGTLDGALTFALLWFDGVRQRASRRATSGVRLFLPEHAVTSAAFRAQALRRDFNLELHAYDEATWHARRVALSDSGNVETRLVPLRDVQRTLESARADLDRIVALAPGAIDCVVPPGTRDVALRFRGLEFARWRRGEIEFGEARTRLTPGQWTRLQRLVTSLAAHRDPHGRDTAHPLYRGAAERWLETLLVKDPARLDPRLDPRYVYSQVPAFSSRDRGVLDLLGVTRHGRLAIVELKASEDLHLPLQAADYWLRVRAHQLAGDFQRFGYFGGVELQSAPPLLLLVAPGFQFHPSTDIVLRYLSPEIEITRVGLNEQWRGELQVIFRM